MQFIRFYKNIESDVKGTFRLVPVPNVELYFNFTGVRLFSNTYYDLEYPRIHIAGLQQYEQEAYTRMDGTGRGGGFAIVFTPTGFYELFKIRSADLYKYAFDGHTLFGESMEELWEKLNGCFDIREMKRHTEQFFSKKMTKTKSCFRLVNEVVLHMEMTRGMALVSEICQGFRTTPRSLQRKFKEELGSSPKEMMQILRINHALNLLRHGPETDLTEISYLSGYYDQSHFIREIRKISGISPGLLKNDEPKMNISHDRIMIRTPQES